MKKKFTYEELCQLLYTDSLTSTLSRWYIDENFEKIINNSSENNQEISLALIDIDNFKRINDTYGHIIGDNILQQIAILLKQNLVCSENDYLARYGGDEFIFLSINTNYTDFTARLKQCLDNIFHFDFLSKNEKVKISISAGCADLKDIKEKNLSSCLNVADKKLYEAKKSGRNNLTF